MRVGHGFDAHQFTEGRRLILGGVEIPYEKGLAGHSDADVVIHAVCDALLGAAALGDIGQYFPNTKEFINIDSRILLHQISELLIQHNYSINNIDVTVIAQEPKLAPYRDQMRNNLAADLKINIDQVSVKATTTDNMGFIGRKEGVAAQAVVIITNNIQRF